MARDGDAADALVEIRVADGVLHARLRPDHAARLCAGHFPDDPVVPGAALAGLMAETAARLTGGTLVEIERCVFRRRVRPDATIAIEARREGAGGRVTVTALVDGRPAARARLRFAPG